MVLPSSVDADIDLEIVSELILLFSYSHTIIALNAEVSGLHRQADAGCPAQVTAEPRLLGGGLCRCSVWRHSSVSKDKWLHHEVLEECTIDLRHLKVKSGVAIKA